VRVVEFLLSNVYARVLTQWRVMVAIDLHVVVRYDSAISSASFCDAHTQTIYRLRQLGVGISLAESLLFRFLWL
jgi:hypothetical protein